MKVCEACGEEIEVDHACKQYEARCSDETLAHGYYHCALPETAAIEFTKVWGVRAIICGDELVVQVRRIGRGDWATYVVTGEMVPTYSARRAE